MRRLAEVLEAISATTSKLQKIDLLAGYLRSLDDEEVRIACTYFTGAPFPAGDGRVLNVGWSAIVAALLDVSGASEDDLDRSYLQHGDLGQAASELLTRKARPALSHTPLTLRAVAAAFTRMAAATGKGSRQTKIEGMRSLLSGADPPEAKYLVRIITADMRVGLKEGLLEEAIARAFDQLLSDVRRANMLISDIGVVAVLARHGRLQEAHPQLFRPCHFMLAETIFSAEEAFPSTPRQGSGQATLGAGEAGRVDGDGGGPPASLVVEDKYDGIRAQVHCDGQRLEIFTRTLDSITASFPELHGELLALGRSYIIDGEIVAWKDGRAIPFTLLQQRLRRKNPAALMGEVPVVMFVFDLLFLGNEELLDRPLAERQQILDTLRFGRAVQRAFATMASMPADLEARFREARDRGNEGLVVKRPDSRYQPGRRGRQWVKWKEELATLDVVVVAAEYGHGKRAGVLSDVTFAVRDEDRLAPIGKAYSGLTDEEIASLTAWYLAHTVREHGRVKFVEPKIVLEVAFDAVTRSARHPSGYALRFPRIKRIRDDKTPEETSTLEDVARIFDRQGASRGGVSPKLVRPGAGGSDFGRIVT